MEIRDSIIGDEEKLVKLFSVLETETQFMLMEPDESKLTIEKQAQLIKEFSQSNSRVLFVASENNEIVGFLGGTGGYANRERHTIKIAMGILASYWGKDIGVQLLQALFTWAKMNHFHRIELTVMEENLRAKALYSKVGFEIEGVKRKSLKVSGKYTNELLMSKLI